MEIVFSQTETALISAVKSLKSAGLPAPELPAHLTRDYAQEVQDILASFDRLTLTAGQADSLIGDLRKLLARYSAPIGNTGAAVAGTGTAVANAVGRQDERRKTLIELLSSGTVLYIKNLPLSYDPTSDELVAGTYRARSISGLAKMITGTSVNGWTLVMDRNGKRVF